MKMSLTRGSAKRLFGVLMVSLVVAQTANAFEGFSRSCKWTDLPENVRLVATAAFQLEYSGTYLPALPQSVQQTLVAQESITANYGNSEELFLLAFSAHYARNIATGQAFREAYYVSEWNGTGYWTNNRGFFFSARAGFGGNNLSKIFEPKSQSYIYSTIGTHAGWNGVTQTLIMGYNSLAFDCNCKIWGFEMDAANQAMSIIACN